MKRSTLLMICGAIIAVFCSTCPAVMSATEPAGKVFSGRVVDVNGRPVAGARVSVFACEGTTQSRLLKTLRADAQGRFSYTSPSEMKNLETQSYPLVVFRAVADGLSYGVGQTDISRHETVIQLMPEYRLTGKVVDDSGRPVAGANVVLALFSGSDYSATGRALADSTTASEPIEAITKKDGSYTLCHLAHPADLDYCNVGLEVSAKGYAKITQRYGSVEDSVIEAPITLPKESIIEGTLRLPGGGFAPKGTRLAAYSSSYTGSPSVQTTVGRNGRYRFGSLSPAMYKIVMIPESGGNGFALPRSGEPRPWVLPVTQCYLTPWTYRRLDLQLITGVYISGRVMDRETGKPLVGEQVRVLSNAAEIGYDTVVTDSDGRFADRIPPERTTVRAENLFAEGVSLDCTDGATPRTMTIEGIKVALRSSKGPVLPGFEMLKGDYDLTWDTSLDCPYHPSAYPPSDDPTRRSMRYSDENDQIRWRVRGLDKITPSPAYVHCFSVDGYGESGALTVATGKSSADAVDFDTVYIDRNRNLDLSDDESIKLVGRATEWVQVSAHQGNWGGDQTAEPLMVRVRTSPIYGLTYAPGSFASSVTLDIRGGWRGKIKTSAGKLGCALIDLNLDGVYDALFVDDNGDSMLDTGQGAHSGEADYVGQCEPLLLFLDKFYSITAYGGGNRLTIDPYTGPAGTVTAGKITVNGATGVYRSGSVSAGWMSVPAEALRTPAKIPVKIPARQYVFRMTISLWADGRRMTDCELQTPVKVEAGEETKVDIDGRIECSISPRVDEMVWRQNEQGQFAWVMKLGDAVVTSIGRPANCIRQPSVDILDASGKLVYSTSKFEYPPPGDPMDPLAGHGYSISVSDLAPGDYTLQVSLDTMSKLGVLSSKRKVTITR